MIAALYIISVFWIALGAFLIIDTKRSRELLKKLFFRKNIKLWGILPLIFGLILVVGAFYYSRLFWVAFIMGLLAILKGIYLFIGRSSHVEGLLEWWFLRAADETIRLFGLIIFILGSALLSYLR
jgi:hypothetical protein